jgi:hypothetical protein
MLGLKVTVAPGKLARPLAEGIERPIVTTMAGRRHASRWGILDKSKHLGAVYK